MEPDVVEVLEASPAPKAPRYFVIPRRRVWIALFLALILGVIATVGVIVHHAIYDYDPLKPGGMLGTFERTRQIDAPEYPGASIYDFVPGKAIQFGFSVWNSGSRPVRIVDLPAVPVTPYMHRVRVEVQDTDVNGGMIGPWHRFVPFTLHADETRQFRVTYKFVDCDLQTNDESGFSWDRQPVKYEVWGVSRTRDVAFGMVVGVQGVSGECS